MRWLPTVALVLLAAGCARHRPMGTGSLAARMRAELDRDARLELIPGPVPERRFLFVAGFLNEGIPGYFHDNLEVVTEEAGAVGSCLFPPSAGDLLADAAQIRDAVTASHAADGRAVVLVGHSKGGAAALLAVLRFPELVLSGKVDRVVSIQGAIGGSPVADSLLREVPLPFRGLEALAPARARALFGVALTEARSRLSPEDLIRLSSRVFYVRSQETVSGVAPELAVTATVLSRLGANDGLLLERDMMLDGFGVDLGVLRADHAALTVASPLANSTSRERRAFTRALLGEIFER